MTLEQTKTPAPSASSPAGARPGPTPWWAFAPLVVPMALSVMLCWGSAQRLRNDYLEGTWPVAEATIVSSQVTFRRQRQAGRRSPWAGWCVSWNYDYPWRGGRIGGTLEDSTPSTLSAGCFSDRERAQDQARRRSVGSTIRVRIDPHDPWTSTTGPSGIQGWDVVQLLLGLIPAAAVISLLGRDLRKRRS